MLGKLLRSLWRYARTPSPKWLELIRPFLAGLMLSVYFANKDAPKGPSVNPGPPNWTSYGCWQDGNPRTLSHTDTSIQFSNMTVALCTSACGNNGYTLAGVEYSGECYCVCERAELRLWVRADKVN